MAKVAKRDERELEQMEADYVDKGLATFNEIAAICKLELIYLLLWRSFIFFFLVHMRNLTRLTLTHNKISGRSNIGPMSRKTQS